MGSLSDLRQSLSNLHKMFSSTDNAAAGALVNLALALPGIALWAWASGWVQLVGAAWALINLAGIASVVIRE